MNTMMTESGRTKVIPDRFMREKQEYPGQLTRDKIAGLDSEGRIVVDMFDARNGSGDYLFGLTLCCNASDKGTEMGVVCRGCYSSHDVGSYLWKAEDGSFPGLDRVVTYFVE